MKSTAPVVLLAVGAMALSLTTLGVLLGVRLVASDRLRHMSDAMKELGNASIETTITVRQTLPLAAQINIIKPTQIDLTLDVSDKIPIRLEVKVDETLTVPLDLQIDEQIPLVTAMTITEKSRVRVKADIDVEQPVRWRLFNRVAPLLNIKGTIPLDQEVEVAFPEIGYGSASSITRCILAEGGSSSVGSSSIRISFRSLCLNFAIRHLSFPIRLANSSAKA